MYDPGFHIGETQTIAASWLGDLLGPASLRDAATDEALGLLPALRRLPRRLDRITTALERGTFTTSVRLLADDRDRHFVRAMVGRAVLEMTRGFAAALREELDFRIEARNIAAVASSSRVRVPAVYQQWSTSRVLVPLATPAHQW